jgi:hypothetical protein
VKTGGKKATLFNAIRAMQGHGLLAVDDRVKPKICHLVRKPEEGQESVF